MVKYIDSSMFKNMLIGAATNLENNKAMVDALNVFPVPDGDTGTNMNLTVQSAVKEISEVKEFDIEKIANAAAKGSLMGARGNSGVILSQLFRGFAKKLEGTVQIDSVILAEAFKSASDTAYKAVMKPVEGTILTVSRESAHKAMEICHDIEDLELFFEEVIKEAKISLDNTPNLLPVLKQADVVDAGGKGLLCLLEGAYAVLKGIEIVKENTSDDIKETLAEVSMFGSEDEIEFAYCTEFMIKGSTKNYEQFLPFIVNRGDSIVCVGADDIIKVHIHTNDPGKILSKAVTFGELINVKIDNMKEQFRNINSETNRNNVANEKEKEFGAVAIGFGKGIQNVFYDLNVDHFIAGGQTMNPSTEDILEAVNKINARNIFVLPNNSNIILAAQQAKELSDKNLIVIPTKTIPQGISAMIAFNDENNAEDNEKNMLEAIGVVKTGQITYAVRDTSMNNLDIKKDDIIALLDGEIVNHGSYIESQTIELVEKMVTEDNFIVTIFYGEKIQENTAMALKAKLEKIVENCDVEVVFGGQPLYYYIISVE